MKALPLAMLCGALTAHGLTPDQKPLSPKLSAMILKVESRADALGMRGWPNLEDLEAEERKADPYVYTSDPHHAASHRQLDGLNPEEAAVWDNPRVQWFQDGPKWDAAILMPDEPGNLHLIYVQDAFGSCKVEEVPFFEPELNGTLEPFWVLKNNGPGEVVPGPDFADGVGEPAYSWDPKEGLVPALADVSPSIIPDNEAAEDNYDGFVLHREDLKEAHPVDFGTWSMSLRIKGRLWTCPTPIWHHIAKACHLKDVP